MGRYRVRRWQSGISLLHMEQPALGEYRDAIASVHLDGVCVGYLATQVEAMRAGFLLRRMERVWLLLTLLDGTVEIEEDYPPRWWSVRELAEGHITWSSLNGRDVDYEVRWLTGDARERAWGRYGIVEEVGTYISRMYKK